jgi:biotin operon repressor
MTSAQARRALLPYLPRVRSLRAAKTLLALLLHTNARGESWPSGAALARATGLPVRSVWAGLRELEALGLVARVPRGHGRANLYRMMIGGSLPGVTHVTRGSDPRATRIVSVESPPQW